MLQLLPIRERELTLECLDSEKICPDEEALIQLSWNEIRERAQVFAGEWEGVASEKSEAKSFWDAFFNIFGIPRRQVASFEEPVKAIKGKYHFIDLFWPGKMLVEHKSAGQNLDKASSQAFNYIRELEAEGRRGELPRYVVLSDFQRFVIYDLEPTDEDGKAIAFDNYEPLKFSLKDLHKNIRAFAFLRGEKALRRDPEDPANIKAAELMGRLHEALQKGGFKGHDLERLLVRILFCLFAEDTSVFDANAFTTFIQNRTREDGSDLGAQLNRLFEILNTPEATRQKNLDEDLAIFPYINGALFQERLSFADFDAKLRKLLLDCTRFDWSRISPGVFGSLFQSIMSGESRREQGAHYTSEADILKVIRPLFLDDLKAEFEAIKTDKARRSAKLDAFHQKLCDLKLLDPACGCGNFLVIAYRELRILELELLKLKYGRQTELTLDDVNKLSKVNVDQMYGIELDEWPGRIAEVALWLMDHQMNLEVSEVFHQRYLRIPLKASPHIRQANALRTDWNTVLPATECSYILGNPPFRGPKFMDSEQKKDMELVAMDVENFGLLDYVTAWYIKAADYIRGTKIKVGFVSTNSVTQGEQPGVLWAWLFKQGIKIHFGHRTFSWESEASGKAHVHVVIIGFGAFDISEKRIFDYEADPTHPVELKAKNISPYLVQGPDLAIQNRTIPLCQVPGMVIGNKPIDDGQYLFTPEEKKVFLDKEPAAKAYFRRWIGSDEFINGIERWCLWLGECPPEELRKMKEAQKRVEAVKNFRLASKSAPTRKIAEKPTRFHVEFLPKGNYLVMPEVSSEKRLFIPTGFLKSEVLPSSLVKVVPGATLFHFGILTSTMHMAWMRHVGGRLESRYRYSVQLVYNNFPWPENIEVASKQAVEKAAQGVLDARAAYPKATLADLYDPLTMPADLRKAHAALDKAVDKCYRKEAFGSERERVEFLFAEYQKLDNPLGLKDRLTKQKKSTRAK